MARIISTRAREEASDLCDAKSLHSGLGVVFFFFCAFQVNDIGFRTFFSSILLFLHQRCGLAKCGWEVIDTIMQVARISARWEYTLFVWSH